MNSLYWPGGAIVHHHLIHGSLHECESDHKQHLDWFSRFCMVHKFAQHRGRQMTEHEMCVAIGRIRVMRAMWPYN